MELIKEEQKLDGQQGGRRGVLQKVLRAAVSGGQYLKEVRGYMTGARKLQGKVIFHYPQGLTQVPLTLTPTNEECRSSAPCANLPPGILWL